MENVNFNMQSTVLKSAIDNENLTVSVVLSDETAVQRYSYENGTYYLTLEHSEDAIDLSRKDILGLYINHNTCDLPIAKYEEVRIEDKKLKAKAVFDGEDEESMRIFKKLSKGFLQSFSVGVTIYEKVLEKEVEGVKYYRATKWEIYECSVVGIPAIPTAKVGLTLGTIPANAKIVNSNNKDKVMEFSQENFDKLKFENTKLDAELTKATAEMDRLKAELEKSTNENSSLTIECNNAKANFESKEAILSMAFELEVPKDTALEMLKCENIEKASFVATKAMASNGGSFVGGDTQFTNEKQDFWSDIK